MRRIRIRMFFVKFVELRGAKLLGLYAFKENQKLTEKLQKFQSTKLRRIAGQVFGSFKDYTLIYCK